MLGQLQIRQGPCATCAGSGREAAVSVLMRYLPVPRGRAGEKICDLNTTYAWDEARERAP